MGALKCLILALALLAASRTEAQILARWQPYVAEASARFGVPQGWIWRVMAAESGGRTLLGGKPIRSPKGAIGLMQLMPATWRAMREACGLGGDPDEPRDNILAGTAYLRRLYDRYGYPGLFAAYNAGPGRYEDYLAGRPLPAETRRYADEIAGRTDRPLAAGSPAAARAAPPAGLLGYDRGDQRLFAVRHP